MSREFQPGERITTIPEPGDLFPVWWNTGRRFMGNGHWQARVLKCEPYTGRYRDLFSHTLRLTAPNTLRGWLEQCIKVEAS